MKSLSTQSQYFYIKLLIFGIEVFHFVQFVKLYHQFLFYLNRFLVIIRKKMKF